MIWYLLFLSHSYTSIFYWTPNRWKVIPLFCLGYLDKADDLAWMHLCWTQIAHYLIFLITLIILALKMYITCVYGFEIKLGTPFSKLGGHTSGVVYALNTFVAELRCHMPVLSDLLWVQGNSAHKKTIRSTPFWRYWSKNKGLKRNITVRPKEFWK